jgi:hypothetical protein
MPHRLFRLYQRKRIININANIVAAGLAALLPTALVAHIAETLWPELAKWAISGIAVGADIFFDVMIFFGLHWIANHWRPFHGKTDAERMALSAKPPPFMMDAAMLQVERAIFSPLYYATAWLGTLLLQRWGLGAGAAVLIAFPRGMIASRIAHTIWGLRVGRFLDHDERQRRREIAEAGRAAAAEPAPSPTPSATSVPASHAASRGGPPAASRATAGSGSDAA